MNQFWTAAHLYVLVEGVDIQANSKAPRLRNLVHDLITAGVSLIQLRDKNLTDPELISAGRIVAELTRESKTLFIMNDRADLAIAAGADGVHLGQDDMSVVAARKIFSRDKANDKKYLIGVSTHSIQQARQAVVDEADYIGVGPVFPSRTKSFKAQVGVELVARVAKEITLPAFAIGGINLTNVDQIVAAGLNRVAVIAAVVKSDNPVAAAKEFVSRLSS